jgi:signal transduction histidine kinase
MKYFKIFFFLLVCGFTNEIVAQQNRLDSIVTMLQKTKLSKGIDSTAFTNVMSLIAKTTLNDTTIAQLEKAGNLFINGVNEYWSYRVKYSILISLTATDINKALTYGKYHFEAAKKSKTPDASFVSSTFFKGLRFPYRNSDRLSEGFQYFNEKLKEYKINNDSTGITDSYFVLAGFYWTIGLLDQAIYNMKKSVSYINFKGQNDVSASVIFTNPLQKDIWLNNNAAIGIYYLQKGAYTESLKYSNIRFNEFKIGNAKTFGTAATNIAYAKILAGQLDSVSYFLDLALDNKENQKGKAYISFALQIKALYKIETGALEEAELLVKQCWKLIEEYNIPVSSAGTLAPDYYLALVRIKQNRLNDAIELLIKDIIRLKNSRLDILRDYKMLAALYEQTGNYEKANDAHKMFISLQDSLQADQDQYRSLSFETEQEMSEKEVSINKLQSENKISALTRNFSFGMAGLLLLLAGVVYYRYKSKQKANLVLQEQKQKVETTLKELKSTQSQLIQSEKMASLGELTAGIAHEIQNPLNFVNNFSEVNMELIDELKTEVRSLASLEMTDNKLEMTEQLIDDIKSNSEKINHHGQRAAEIVKGMLQHSRSSSGVKEPTDINALCDEYLRLSYHGLRAKDKTFNATMKTDFDESIGKINIIPQDIGRVVLNLLTNAFYAVDERLRQAQGDIGYTPTVTVSTKKVDSKVEIKVSDNGNGIPQKVVDKIFQPFFTTKPTGQGTGLGLSLSYDIVKAHGGELKAETKEGEGSTFSIQIPTN